MNMELKIAHLYPELLNLYGDRGNLSCLSRRLNWRGIDCRVDLFPVGAACSFADYDLFYMGGGQDFAADILLPDLREHRAAELRAAMADGRTFLCICGGFQLLGHYFETAAGERRAYLGCIDGTTGELVLCGGHASAMTDRFMLLIAEAESMLAGMNP